MQQEYFSEDSQWFMLVLKKILNPFYSNLLSSVDVDGWVNTGGDPVANLAV